MDKSCIKARIILIFFFTYFFSAKQIFCALKYSATSYILYPQLINSGGGKKVSSNNLKLSQTIGQSIAGVSQTINKKIF